ncbi:MAG: hypothetical protein JWO37_2678 [Acidimicrobiales bacterium]|jgi:lysylphosphatidylglycerol synthetase-like protein (DUF2156 family)|nr:hypothetical protein [Acidimicrobiales bacterium]
MGPVDAPVDVLVPDQVEVAVPAGGKVLVASDMHLGPSATAGSTATSSEVARAIEGWVGPGLVVLAGDVFDLLAGPNLDVEIILSAHPRLKAALTTFSGEADHRLVVLPGTHDSRLGWDERQVTKLRKCLGAEVAFALDIVIETGRGERRVRVEHGHQYDPHNSFADPRNPNDTPFGQHVVTEIAPALAADGRAWLDGVTDLDDPVAYPEFVASRTTYRRLARHVWWLLVPLALAVLLKVPLVYALIDRGGQRDAAWLARRTALISLAVVADVLIVAAGLVFAARRVWAAAADMGFASRRQRGNEAARAAARALVPRGYAALVTGHTHQPELTVMGDAFYANAGSSSDHVRERSARLGLPPVYLPQRQISWVEMEAGADLHARLIHAAGDLPGGTRVERLAAQPLRAEPRPAVVAAFPQGPSWPEVVPPMRKIKRARRIAAGAIALAGIVNITSAVSPPFRSWSEVAKDAVPLTTAQTAAALVALAGLALLVLARGVRGGQRHAWQLAMGLLVGSAGLHLLKGVDVEDSLGTLAIVGYLWLNRRAFRARTDPPAVVRGLVTLVAGAAVAVISATAAVELVHRDQPRPPIGRAVLDVLSRMVGSSVYNVPGRVDGLMAPVLVALSVGLVLAAGWIVFRPVVVHRHQGHDDRARARDVVARFGGDTLAYFALRDDKSYFFSGASVVAYAVVGGIALVSPDPIGPEAERTEVWNAFRRFADEHAWPIAVMGASESWLPIYRAAGMHDLYVGDEAVVDITRFSLEGGRAKGLRQAVNRVAKRGYTIAFHDPANLPAGLESQLTALMGKSRKGDVERGFSMTLGRVFHPDDKGLLLAVAFGPGGEPAAFCQYVPAADIEGYSLDLMRRADDGDADDGSCDADAIPNGVTDFVVVETINHLRQRGCRGLALNFATMRAVLAGESGDSMTQRVERWLLQKMSESMQIESLWYFNAKYDPDWRPRYAVYDSPEHLLASAMAVARAESFWELPLIGRFFVPSSSEK